MSLPHRWQRNFSSPVVMVTTILFHPLPGLAGDYNLPSWYLR
jgi:hypothetical protein